MFLASSSAYSQAVPTAGSVVTIRNVNSELCVDTGGYTTVSLLFQASCSGASSQNFTLQTAPATGYYYLVSSASELCWDVAGGSTSAGAGIQQYTCLASWAKYYQLNQVSVGVYKILSGNMTNGCIDVAGASTASGATIEQNACDGSTNQTFQISLVGNSPPPVAVSASPASASVASADATKSASASVTISAPPSPNTFGYAVQGVAVSTATSNTVSATRYQMVGQDGTVTSLSVFIASPVSACPNNQFQVAIYTDNNGTPGALLASSGSQAIVPDAWNTVPISASVTANAYYWLAYNTNGLAADSNNPRYDDGGAPSTTWIRPAPFGTWPATYGPIGGLSSYNASMYATFALSGTLVDVTTFGAMGNGTTDDTAAINNAIATLTSGSTLLFPCGTYLTTSQLTINISNVTVDGSSCAIILNTNPGSKAITVIGGSGNGNPNYGPSVALSATANELSTSFTTVSSLGVSTGDYVYLQQGGIDGSNGSGDTGCDPSGCRGEVLKVASVSGNTVTVTTALHDTYDPAVNAAIAQKILGPLTGITVKNISFDGNRSNVYGFEMAGVADSSVSGVTSRNVQGAAILTRGNFNVAWSNMTVTGAGSAQCGDAVWFENQGNLSVNGMSISNENPGTGAGCLSNGAFGFGLIDSANGTITNLTVDAAGAYGRPFKMTASRWNTFNSLTVKNGVQAYNGISLEYYSSHNTFNSCVVTNNGAGTGTGSGNAGINSFGNFNQFNTFNNCTVTGNGNVQVLINNYDALHLGQDSNVTIKGGTYTGTNTVEPVIYVIGSNANVASATINGPGAHGLYLGSTNACANYNIFGVGTGLTAGITSSSSTNSGSVNIMNGSFSNLAPGTCIVP